MHVQNHVTRELIIIFETEKNKKNNWHNHQKLVSRNNVLKLIKRLIIVFLRNLLQLILINWYVIELYVYYYYILEVLYICLTFKMKIK